MRANPIKLKKYAPEWTQLLTAIAFTFATLFAGKLFSAGRKFCDRVDEHLPASRT